MTLKLSKVIGFLCVAVVLSACNPMDPEVKSQVDYAKFSQQEAPLSTNLSDEDEYQFALDLAAFQVQHQKFDQAESLLQKLRKENHLDIRVYRLLAQLYEGKKNYDLALIAWREVNKLKQSNIDDEANLARLAIMSDAYSEAEEIYQTWLQNASQSTQVSALNNLGFSALLQKKYSEARVYFEQALQKDPLNTKAINNLQLVKTLEDKTL